MLWKMDRERIFRDEGEDCQCATKRAYGGPVSPSVLVCCSSGFVQGQSKGVRQLGVLYCDVIYNKQKVSDTPVLRDSPS